MPRPTDDGPRYGLRRAFVAVGLAVPVVAIIALVTGGGGGDSSDVTSTAAVSSIDPGPTAAATTLQPTTLATTTVATTTLPPTTTSTTTTLAPTTSTTTAPPTTAPTTILPPTSAPAPPTSALAPISSIDDVGGPWWLVNGNRPLPAGYVPPQLRTPDVPLKPTGSFTELTPETAAAFEAMVAAASSEAGHQLQLNSAYRSFVDQQQLYAVYERDYGPETAARLVARPGTSEHQTGLAADVGLVGLPDDQTFGSTAASGWVAENAHRFGLIVRYPPDKAHITGYANEPWHLRYVGVELAGVLHAGGLTMEEHFGLA